MRQTALHLNTIHTKHTGYQTSIPRRGVKWVLFANTAEPVCNCYTIINDMHKSPGNVKLSPCNHLYSTHGSYS